MTPTPINVKEQPDQRHAYATRDGIRHWELGGRRGLNA